MHDGTGHPRASIFRTDEPDEPDEAAPAARTRGPATGSPTEPGASIFRPDPDESGGHPERRGGDDRGDDGRAR